jgi:hypothetical protein
MIQQATSQKIRLLRDATQREKSWIFLLTAIDTSMPGINRTRPRNWTVLRNWLGENVTTLFISNVRAAALQLTIRPASSLLRITNLDILLPGPLLIE